MLHTNTLSYTNCIDAETHTRYICKIQNGKHDTEWCRKYFSEVFPQFLDCKMGRILMGKEKGDKGNYYYVPNPF